MREDHDPPLPAGRNMFATSDPDTFQFPYSVVTITIRGTEYCTLTVSLPGAQPFSIVCSQSTALTAAVRDACTGILPG